MSEQHADFRHVVHDRVRFGDVDAMKHLNNVALLRTLETGRVQYMVDLGLARFDELTFVLARLEVDFTAQAFFGEELACGSRVSQLGRTSMTLDQCVWRPDGTDVGRGRSIMVTLAADTVTPAPLPQRWRDRIAEWEPRELADART